MRQRSSDGFMGQLKCDACCCPCCAVLAGRHCNREAVEPDPTDSDAFCQCQGTWAVSVLSLGTFPDMACIFCIAPIEEHSRCIGIALCLYIIITLRLQSHGHPGHPYL